MFYHSHKLSLLTKLQSSKINNIAIYHYHLSNYTLKKLYDTKHILNILSMYSFHNAFDKI